jgi:hypothetical protein
MRRMSTLTVTATCVAATLFAAVPCDAGYRYTPSYTPSSSYRYIPSNTHTYFHNTNVHNTNWHNINVHNINAHNRNVQNYLNSIRNNRRR